MSQIRACSVSFVDPDGIRHAVQVTAASLYEAAALAMIAFRSGTWHVCPGPGAQLEITITAPAVSHSLTVRQLQRWVESNGKSPREHVLKSRLREMLDSPAVD